MKTTLQHSKHVEPSNADITKAFVKLLGFFTVSVLPLAGLALINWIMSFIF